jgi:cytochrome c-type biogenesis protein CcmH
MQRRKFITSFLGLGVAAIAIGQERDPVSLVSPEIRRVGRKLACRCGVCNNTVADCAMLECGYCLPARRKIADMQKAGQSDDFIVASFVKESGASALSQPPTEGFSLLSWVMPFVAIGIGLVAITFWIKKYQPKPAGGLPEVDSAMLNRYRDRIEKDMAKND